MKLPRLLYPFIFSCLLSAALPLHPRFKAPGSGLRTGQCGEPVLLDPVFVQSQLQKDNACLYPSAGNYDDFGFVLLFYPPETLYARGLPVYCGHLPRNPLFCAARSSLVHKKRRLRRTRTGTKTLFLDALVTFSVQGLLLFLGVLFLKLQGLSPG